MPDKSSLKVLANGRYTVRYVTSAMVGLLSGDLTLSMVVTNIRSLPRVKNSSICGEVILLGGVDGSWAMVRSSENPSSHSPSPT